MANCYFQGKIFPLPQ